MCPLRFTVLYFSVYARGPVGLRKAHWDQTYGIMTAVNGGALGADDRKTSSLGPRLRPGAVMSGGQGGGKDREGDRDDEGKTGIVTKTRPKTKKPNLYKVLLLNDDYTPMEFVVHVLEKYFAKGREEANKIMLHVHHKGVGICGVYTYEVAETKVTLVMDFSREHGHPLQCTMEKE